MYKLNYGKIFQTKQWYQNPIKNKAIPQLKSIKRNRIKGNLDRYDFLPPKTISISHQI